MTAGRGMVAPALLILAAAALGGTIALELGRRLPDSDRMVPATAPLPAPAAPASAPVAEADDAGRRVAEVLARPLFSPGRRPAAQAAGTGAATAALPRMTGVIVTPAGRRAIFANGAGKAVVVMEGGRIGAYDVQSIEAGRVTLAGPDGKRVVAPAFDPKPAARTAGPAPGLLGLPGLPGLQGLAGLPGLDGPPPVPAVPGMAGFPR
jgi:hypothetical protein